MPTTWGDLLKPCYKGLIVAGHTDDDINELLLLEIYKEFGEEGIKQLATNFGTPMNTIEMVKHANEGNGPYAIYIVPYFFAKAAPQKEYLKVIWPEDGAIMCPLYLIVKRERNNDFDSMIEFIFSKELGEKLAHIYFPHVNKEANNNIPTDSKLRWIGWDYLYKMNIMERVRQIEQIWYRYYTSCRY